MGSKIKRLFLDIETSHSVVATFSLWPNFISPDNILQEWFIICAAWKWEGQKTIYGKKSVDKCDKKVVAALRQAIIDADEVVYHNGRKFDYKKLNARVLLNGLPPMAKPRECDTLLQVRKHFGFTSNKLDYVGQILGCGGKISTGNSLWLASLNNDKQAIAEMYRYNKRDVELLEQVYQKIKPYIDVGYNHNIKNDLGLSCPACDGSNYQQRGWSVTNVGKYKRYQCQDCAKWFQDGKREKQTCVKHR